MIMSYSIRVGSNVLISRCSPRLANLSAARAKQFYLPKFIFTKNQENFLSMSISNSSEVVPLPSHFITKLTSDKVSEDGYSVENLLLPSTVDSNSKSALFPKLSADTSIFRMNPGFMAANFTKPPVVLTWTFQKPVELYAVHLGLSVGKQRTMGLEIFVGQDDSESQIQRRVACAYFSRLSPPDSCVIRRQNVNLDFAEIGSDSATMYFFKANLLDRVQTLVIKIMKSYHIPCLAFAKIYVKKFDGLDDMSPNGTEEISQTINGPSCSYEDFSINNDQKIEASTFIQPQIDDKAIPKEFFDPLTHHCMSLPIILPSGHTIDRSTLERYLEEEARYGRSANDPFTNVRFTDSSFPLPNSRLKERIDRYFLMHPNLAKEENFGRTLCGGGQYSVLSKSKLSNKRKSDESTVYDGKRRHIDLKGNKNSDKDDDKTPDYARKLLENLPSFL